MTRLGVSLFGDILSMDQDPFEPNEEPETREEYIERFFRHFHVCLLAIVLSTVVGYFANSLELLEQQEYLLTRQLQHIRNVRQQQSCAFSALASVSRNLTAWTGVDTGVIASLGTSDSLANAWSDADGNIYPAESTVEERISFSQCASWEGEIDGLFLPRGSDAPPGSAPEEGHGEEPCTMETGDGSENGESEPADEEGAAEDLDWIPFQHDDEEDEDYIQDDGSGARPLAPPWARSSAEDEPEPNSEAGSLDGSAGASSTRWATDTHTTEISDARPHHGPNNSSARPHHGPPKRFVGQRRSASTSSGSLPAPAKANPAWRARGSAGRPSQPRPEPDASSGPVAPWKRPRTV